jgi:hypothetical protein
MTKLGKEKLLWKTVIAWVVVVSFMYFQFMNWTGGCASKFSYLTDQQLVQAQTDDRPWSLIPQDRKNELNAGFERNKEGRLIVKHRGWIDPENPLRNKFLGSYFYQITTYAKPNPQYPSTTFKYSIRDVNGC